MAKKRPKKQSKKRIRDIASMKELSTTATSMVNLKQTMPILGPLFKEFGIEVDKMEDALSNIAEVDRQTNEFVKIPDMFNNYFAEHGWIMYNMMNFDVAKEAVLAAEEGDFKGALALILQYYNVETIRFQLKRLNSINAFRPRMELALKALIDYEEKRYHACVPVILALTDGLVNELHEDRKGISAESTKLEAWDSIAAHSKNYGNMTRILPHRVFDTKTAPLKLREHFRNQLLTLYEFVSINDLAISNTAVSVRLQVEEYGHPKEKFHKFIMICENDQSEIVSPSKPGSKWVS